MQACDNRDEGGGGAVHPDIWSRQRAPIIPAMAPPMMPCSGRRPEAMAKPMASGIATMATIRPAAEIAQHVQLDIALQQVFIGPSIGVRKYFSRPHKLVASPGGISGAPPVWFEFQACRTA